MNKWKFTVVIAICIGFALPVFNFGQGISWVKQTITSNSGKFEFSPPYQDYVSLQAFNVLSQSVNQFGTIYTQSSQDILITDNMAYFACQDSIVKYNLTDFSRMAAIADSGLSKLCMMNGKLLVSKQYPVSTYFLEVLDTADLSLVARVEGLSGDCGGIAVLEDTVYVAVNGGWMGTEGKLAVIETAGWTLREEVNFGPDAIGIMQIYPYKNRIITVNKSPYATPGLGSITVYEPSTQSFVNSVFNVNVGTGTGIKNDLLFLGLNYGIGSVNLNTMQIADTNIVPDPGSAFFRYITSSALDTVMDRLYVNTGDYTTAGSCLVTNLSGDSITSYATGISSDAVAIDYRESPAGIPVAGSESSLFSVYPNPATDMINLNFKNTSGIDEIIISDMTGKKVIQDKNVTGNTMMINICHLPSGLYCIVVKAQGNTMHKKFIKQ